MKNSIPKPKTWLTLFLLTGSLGFARAEPVKGGFTKVNDWSTLQRQFASPPQEYAPHAFWFWNARLNEQHSTAMAREMSRQGLNPGYIHPRHLGLDHTEGLPAEQWLSPEYFDCIRAVLEECRKAGTFLGFNDEYWWPSGRIGGRMVTEHPEMQAKELTWEKWTKIGRWTVYLPPCEFIVACRETSQGVIDAATLQVISTGEPRQWQVPDEGGEWSLYIFRKVATASRDRGTDETLVNYMEPKLADYAIEMGLRPYEENLKDYLGGPLRYAFSDNEGEYGNRLPWSDYMVTFYRQLYGEDIRKSMPLLLTEDSQGTWVTARYRWFNQVSEIYAHRFWKPMNDWLARRGLYYVSNFWEDDLLLQAATVGDYFRVNRAFSMPGNDALMMNAADPLQFKEIQSICEFEDRPFMSEIMGVQGWKQLPTDMKQVANFATAWGVTHLVPHGVSLDQDLKNTLHPADWYNQNPYWETMRQWTDFCRRASFVNRQGRLATDVLIYNPMTSIWSLSENFLSGRSPSRSNWANPLAKSINTLYYGIQKKLSENNVEYLIADDVYIQKSSLNPASAALDLLGHRFHTLILPPLFTVVTGVYERIVAFAAAGGKVILLGQLPVSSAEKGLNDPAILRLNDRLRSLPSVVAAAPDAGETDRIVQAAGMIPRPIGFQADSFKIYSTHRIIDGNDFYWLANNSGRPQSGTLLLTAGRGRAEKWDCETGRVTPVNYSQSQGKIAIPLEFGPYEGYWLVFDSKREPAVVTSGVTRTVPLPDRWEIGIEGKEVPVTTAEVFVENTAPEARDPSGIPAKGWATQSIISPLNVIGSWKALWMATTVKLGRSYFIHDFELEAQPVRAFLNLAADGGLDLFINGKPVTGLTHAGSWKDPDCIDILRYLRKGKNRIAIGSGKFVASGEYWLLAQGAVTLPDGKTVSIRSGTDWLVADNFHENWTAAGGPLAGFVPAAVRTGKQLSWIRKGEVHPPVSRMISDDETVWLSFAVPPGARRFKTHLDLAQAEIWLDGEKSNGVRSGDTLAFAPETRRVVLKTARRNLAHWTEPGTFFCEGDVPRPLANWDRWGLTRFSGFLDYDLSFEVPALAPGEKAIIDLGRLEHVAELWINGENAGQRMWPPFEFEATALLKPGMNHLKVRVGNLITNRLAVDDDLGRLFRWGNGRIPGARYFQAGLEGPCSLRITAAPR